ncbi:hypothetical protein AYJ54_32280 [Bradyrhizobium centrolobii]|uniref:Uncharacterized protein n=1 Tax=Bradyrhizobium centrolobii TaxID=1505087 RepID=A0A176YAL7_9BRAD|nr:hypothetical protein [Bradyrhizobium centrolobii]OAE99958.1 hypothetical protein AYJ54_32280 [Bradyrhizobium centrolobii]
MVVISLLADFNFGVYEHRTRKLRIALGQNYKDITDPNNWQDYIDGRIYNGSYDLTVGQLSRFAEDFAKIDYGVDDIIDNVRFIRSRMRPHAKRLKISPISEWSNLWVIESLPGGLREVGLPKTIQVDQAAEFVSCASIFKRC